MQVPAATAEKAALAKQNPSKALVAEIRFQQLPPAPSGKSTKKTQAGWEKIISKKIRP